MYMLMYLYIYMLMYKIRVIHIFVTTSLVSFGLILFWSKMANSSSLEASDVVLKSDCKNIIPDLNANLLETSEDSPPQKRSLKKLLNL